MIKFLYSKEVKAGCCVLTRPAGVTLKRYRASKNDMTRVNYYIDTDKASAELLSELKALKGNYLISSSLLGRDLHGRLLVAINRCREALITEEF